LWLAVLELFSANKANKAFLNIPGCGGEVELDLPLPP
jgi:hypothetical protein